FATRPSVPPGRCCRDVQGRQSVRPLVWGRPTCWRRQRAAQELRWRKPWGALLAEHPLLLHVLRGAVSGAAVVGCASGTGVADLRRASYNGPGTRNADTSCEGQREQGSAMDLLSHDILIVGGGGAGLRAAIAIGEENPRLSVGVISKVYPMRSHTVSAEGG